MFTLTRTIPVRRLLLEQAPMFTASILIAEIFYKFGSFSLECLAFLATWFALDGLVTLIRQLFQTEQARLS